MDNIEQIINQYKKTYSTAIKSRENRRLPIQLLNEQDARLRLLAAYSLEVEKRERTFILDTHTDDKISRVARWLYSSSKRGLLLMGTLGNGKSTMMKAIHDVFWYHSICGDAQTIYEYFKKEQALKDWDTELLLIDDLGVEPTRCLNFGEDYHPMSRLILHRYNCLLTTIIATNLSLDEIQERYGDRVVDRMYETYEVIKYDRESYRRER